MSTSKSVSTAVDYDVTEIELSRIQPGDNDRTVFNLQDLETLANSIEADGLAQPITVRRIANQIKGQPVRFEIVAGERRFRAFGVLAQRDPVKWTKIPAMIRDLTDEQASSIMLAENVHRTDLNPMDEARAYDKRMTKFGWTVDEVAKKAEISKRRVENRLELLKLIPEAQELLEKNMVQLGWVLKMVGLDANRQRIAFRYLANTSKPTLHEFEAICGKLQVEQVAEGQSTLPFLVGVEGQPVTSEAPGQAHLGSGSSAADPDAFIEAAKADHWAKYSEQRRRRFPVNSSMPEFKKVGKTIGEAFENYLALLLNSGMTDEAAIVGSVYQGMLSNMMACSPSKKTALDDWNAKQQEEEAALVSAIEQHLKAEQAGAGELTTEAGAETTGDLVATLETPEIGEVEVEPDLSDIENALGE